MPLPFREIKQAGLYWLSSKRGPNDNRRLNPYQLVNGVVTVPVPGAIARDLVGKGLVADDAYDFSAPLLTPDPLGGWRLVSSAPRATVSDGDAPPPCQSPTGPGLPSLDCVSEWPEELPAEYLLIFDLYTRSGKRRRGAGQ